MAKRRSKIKTGGRTGSRITRRAGPAKQPVSTRILTQKLDLNSVPPCDDETCQEKDIHEKEVKGLGDIDTKTATAEQGEDYLSENRRSSDEGTERPAKMKKHPGIKGKPAQLDKAPCTCPREVDGELCVDVECGNNTALLYLSKLCVGSKGACIKHEGSWLTPNEFQFVSGRETAKDWKRSIRHNGFSLKLLIVNGCIELNASPPPTTPTNTAAVTNNNNNNTRKSEGPGKSDEATNGAEDKRRRYIPVKKRNGVVKDKVGGRRKKIRRSKKKPLGNQGVTRPVLECPKIEKPEVETEAEADVEEGDKACAAETSANTSESSEKETVADIKEEEEVEGAVVEKQSEEFFKTLQLSKTPSSTTANSPAAADITDADDFEQSEQRNDLPTANSSSVEEDKRKDEDCNTEDSVLETTDEQTPKVVETFRSRLIPGDTRLRIAINREVVCMKENHISDDVTTEDNVTDAGASKTESHEADTGSIHDLNNTKTETLGSVSDVTIKQVKSVSSIADGLPDSKPKECVKLEFPKYSEDKSIEKEFQKPVVQTHSASPGPLLARNTDTKTEKKSEPTEVNDCKCIDLKDKDFVNRYETSTASPRAYSATVSARDCATVSSVRHQACSNHMSLPRCDYSDNGAKDRDFTSKEPKLNKHTTANSIKCPRKIQESRTSTPKSVAESTFQEKSQYENDMLELMSIYRPVMVPCDGRCPYLCSDSTSPRHLGDTHSPYTACANNKWPVASPFLSGVMTPEMMYYMTQQIYFDMYNSSLYAQCTSNEKLSQAKPVKRKLPEPDQDHPLDLTVKKARTEKDSSKVFYTQDMDSPVDFSKKSSHSYDRKVINHMGKHVRTPSNGAVMTNGYRAKPSPQNSKEKLCTCGAKDDIRNWSVDKVCSFLKQCHDCAIYTKTFREQGIDGRLLPYLTMQHLTRTLGMQTGPATAFLGAVDQQLRGNALQRSCQWCKG